MIKIIFKCDNCRKDLSNKKDSLNYILRLKNELIKFYPENNSFTTILPPIYIGEKNFCGVICLKKWVAIIPD